MANIHDVNESLQVQPSVRNLPTLIALSQGENGRSLRFRMVGATIPSGSSASLSGTKPDGVVYSKAGTVDGNTVIFQEDVQLTAVAGAWDAKIHIVNSGNSVATALIRFIIDPDPVAAGAIPSDTQLEGIVAECKLYAEAARSNAYGSPLTASAAADMIDAAKVYVYTGDETGYTAGHWYYYNGTAWADGGVYNSIAIQTDATLTLPDHAADAKATGDSISTKADIEGTVSMAKALVGGKYTLDQSPYHYRQSPDAGALDETIVGGSLGWNQLCNGSSVTVQSGHKYITKISGAFSIGASDGTAITGLTSGTDMVTDLTICFGTTIADYIYSLETATAGAGVAWVKRYIDLDTYHEYDAGSIQSVEGLESHNTYDEDENLLASYPLDSSVTLRGVPKLVTDHIEFDGDKYRSDGTVERRYGVVDLGTLSWTYQSSVPRFYSTGINSLVKKPLDAVIANVKCIAFTTTSVSGRGATIYGGEGDKLIAVGNTGTINIKDTSYTDAASFKTAVSGVYLVYELATPTTETAQPYQSPQLVGSTEEYVTTGIVPVGHESRYYEDITGKVNDLPSDFSTLIAPVEKSFTATRNYTVGSFVIVNNQLYKVTSAISSGGTITPNSNCAATTIMAEILALA